MTEPIESKSRGPVRIVIFGAGNRASKYLRYILDNPDKVKLVGIVESNTLRCHRMALTAGVSEKSCFSDFDSFFASKVDADAVLICLPENIHYEPAIKALRAGYNILLEKPIAPTIEECRAIADEAVTRGLIAGVCHVLRYHPYFEKIKEIVDSGRLGEIVSITHRASVGVDRTTHGFVRGQWNREKLTNPMFISKCCHDVDFIVWLTGSRARRVSSFGSLRHFRSECAPEGSAARCIDCSIEKGCPFSAVDLYRNRRDWISNFDVKEGETIDIVIERELAEGRQGRCVYHCDNDVVDHQIVSIEMENDVTVNLSMDCFTLRDNRQTHICLTHGEIYGDEHRIEVYTFRGGLKEVYDFARLEGKPYHAGADLRVVEDFIKAIADSEHKILTDIADSLESHQICFDAEKSRRTGTMISR